MNEKIPRSPFTTPLSGTARETELRLRNIFQWKKRRPPLPLLVLTAAAVLLCGNLVSCQVQESPETSGTPSSGTAQSSGGQRRPLTWAEEVTALAQLYRDSQVRMGIDTSQIPGQEMLATLEGDGCFLAAAHYYDGDGRYSLVLRMVDIHGYSRGFDYIVNSSGGAPLAVPFERDGVPHLLYIANGFHQGVSGGEAGVVRLEGGDFTWVWPVEGNIRDSSTQARADYDSYWEEHKALLAPGGVDVYTYIPSSAPPYQDMIPQWRADHNELFWPAPEEDLPMPVYYKTRLWLEEANWQEDYPRTAHWQITSLEPADGVYHNHRYDGSAVYRLEARSELDPSLFLTATLRFDHGAGEIGEVLHQQTGTWSELHALDAQGNAQTAGEIILAYYRDRFNSTSQVYYSSDPPEAPRKLDLRLEEPVYAGQAEAQGGAAGIYRVEIQQYHSDRRGGPLSFRPYASEYLSLYYDGSTSAPVRVMGTTSAQVDKDPQTVANEVDYRLWHGEVAFYREGDPYLAGPGGQVATVLRKELQAERIYGRPVYDIQHDWWERYSCDGYTAEVYCRDNISSRNNRGQYYTPYYMETTRTDLSTWGGVRVGDSRRTVLDRYPSAVSGDYFGRYPGQDLLYYIPNLAPGYTGVSYEESGPAILFFFGPDGDTVERIALNAPFQ